MGWRPPARSIIDSRRWPSVALPYLLKNEYEKIFEHVLKNSRLIQTGVLSAGPIEAMVRSHVAGHADHGNRLWLLVNLEAWHRIHIDQQDVRDFRKELMGAIAN